MKVRNFLTLFLIPVITISQTKKIFSFEQIPLTEVLQKIEAEYKIKFSYNANRLQGKTISLSYTDNRLEPLLQILEKKLDGSIEKINHRYYVIRFQEEGDEYQICGYIKDASNGEVLGNVTIAIQGRDEGAISDANGYFEILNAKKEDVLIISYIGFSSIEKPVTTFKKGICAAVILFPDNILLGEVLIKEYLIQGIDKTAEGHFIITPQKMGLISGMSEPDLLSSIQQFPGIESPSETASGIFIRGGTPDHNLVLWDGIKMYHTGHFFGMLSTFNPYITKKVKLLKSNIGSYYGDRISGVIDISTEDELNKKVKGGLGSNFTHVDGYIQLPVSSTTGILASFRRSYTDIVRTIMYNRFSERVFQNTKIVTDQDFFTPEFSETTNAFYFSDYTFKIHSKITDKGAVTLSSLYTKNKLDYQASLLDKSEITTNFLTINNKGFSVKYKHKKNAKFSYELSGHYSNYDLNYKGTDLFFGEKRTLLDKENRLEEIGGALDTYWRIGKKWDWRNGVQFFNVDVSYKIENTSDFQDVFDFEDIYEASNIAYAGYSEVTYTGAKDIVIGGIRGSYHHSLNTFLVAPRIAYKRKLTKQLLGKIAADTKNQTVSQIIELYTNDFGLENQLWAVANKSDIPILKSYQIAFGGEYKANSWLIDIEAYYKFINDLSSIGKGFGTEDTEVLSIGENTIKGIDFLVKKKFTNYTSWISYSYAKSDFLFEGLNDEKTFASNYDIRHSLRWSHTYSWNKFMFSLGWAFRSGTPYTEIVDLENEGEEIALLYEELNGNRLPLYHRLDFSTVYTFDVSKQKNIRGKAGFSILNLYDKQNVINRSYSILEEDDPSGNILYKLRQTDKVSLRVTPTVFFRLNF
ncbi:carboxypeptidase-like regulatory domain-containing protein [Aquimarina hainanensis]|uniref:Carboxypeptidase-like regulatory domain-containing protein n=1 Tax=Aquimarina hainanensis TaxID=1578017 RepID=A0ABW5NE92_9FLAO